MNARPRLLIVGGYGTFGSRLVHLLKDDPRLTLVIAGRSRARADAFVAATRCLQPQIRATLEPAAFDRDGALDTLLSQLKPDLLVDASGPFQAMGPEPYRLAQACIRRGISMLDIADSRDFVTGIAALDGAARDADVFVLSGCSTLPALSFAAVDALKPGFGRIDTVMAGIAPSPKVRMRLNVVRAVASYAGKPVATVKDGKVTHGYGLIDGMAATIAPPGALPLARRRFVLADTPDLALLPQAIPGLRAVFTGAGTAPQILQHLLSGMALLVRWRLVPSLLPAAPLLHRAGRILGFGTARGGMIVRLSGRDAAGNTLERSFHLIAEGDDGPFIPAMASQAVIRRWLSGTGPAPGARPAAGALALADFMPLFARFAIASGIRETTGDTTATPLYRRLLGSAWAALPPAVAAMHDSTTSRMVAGRARVERGNHPLARATATIFGFPKASADVPVRVRFDCLDGREIWTRSFAGRTFRSIQSAAGGRDESLLAEDFGPFRVLIALVTQADRLRLVIRGWRFCGIPLPLCLAPGGDTFEQERDGTFHFHVEIGSPLTGLIVRYTGWLRPDTA